MEQDLKFSFVMPAYKKLFLYKAIDSILKQSYLNFECIIINDASPENLGDVVKQFKDKRIRYEVNNQNIGKTNLVSNWNHCIQYANSDYVILATDDDTFEPNFLQEAVKLIKKYPLTDVIRSGVKKINKDDKVIDTEIPFKEYMSSREYSLLYAKGATISCISNYIFKRKSLENIGGFISFPHAHFSDDATVLALSYNGIVCLPSIEMNFRVSDINLSNLNNLDLVLEQINATRLYMEWYQKHLDLINTNPGDYFKNACYGYFKLRYIALLEKLTNKIPLTKALLTFRTILSDKHLYKKEKLKFIIIYFINKL